MEEKNYTTIHVSHAKSNQHLQTYQDLTASYDLCTGDKGRETPAYQEPSTPRRQ